MKLVPNLEGLNKIAQKVESLSISTFKKHVIMSMLEGMLEERLKHVRPDQLYTHITSWKPLTEVLERNGRILPGGTRRTLRGVSRIIDVNKHLDAMEETLDAESGFIMMRALKKVRPDLYQVVVKTPGGQKMIWKDAQDVWDKLKAEIRELTKN